MDTETNICSGQEIDWTTSDPIRLPLLDKRILEMQWGLQQVAALKGGAEVFEDSYDDDEAWQAVVLGDVEEWIMSTPTPSLLSSDGTPPSSPPPSASFIESHAKSATTASSTLVLSAHLRAAYVSTRVSTLEDTEEIRMVEYDRFDASV